MMKQTDRENIVICFDRLSSAGKQKLKNYLEFLEDQENPILQERRDTELLKFMVKIEKVRDYEQTLNFISQLIRSKVNDSLSREMRALFVNFELIEYFLFEAKNRPYTLISERGRLVKAATAAIASAYRSLRRIETAELKAKGKDIQRD